MKNRRIFATILRIKMSKCKIHLKSSTPCINLKKKIPPRLANYQERAQFFIPASYKVGSISLCNTAQRWRLPFPLPPLSLSRVARCIPGRKDNRNRSKDRAIEGDFRKKFHDFFPPPPSLPGVLNRREKWLIVFSGGARPTECNFDP